MDSDELNLLTASLREVVAARPDDLRATLEELGWADVVAADPATATTLLFTEHGRALATAPVLDAVVLPVLAADLPVPADAVCYPAVDCGWTPSSTTAGVSGLLLGTPPPDARVVVPLVGPDGVSLATVTVSELRLAPAGGIDPELTWVTAAGGPPGTLYDGGAWPAAVAAAHRALAAEIIGTAEAALRLAIDHTSSRHQFGAPIATFQAVRHRLADGEVALAAARALLDAAFDAASTKGGTDGGTVAAAAAKAQAGRAHDIVSANAVQVCGAIGATMEHPLHRYVNRGFALDALLGNRLLLASELGARMQHSGEIPRLVEV